MELGIRRAFRFADDESRGKRGSDTDSHFGCISINSSNRYLSASVHTVTFFFNNKTSIFL